MDLSSSIPNAINIRYENFGIEHFPKTSGSGTVQAHTKYFSIGHRDRILVSRQILILQTVTGEATAHRNQTTSRINLGILVH